MDSLTREDLEKEIVATQTAIETSRKIMLFNELSLKSLNKELRKHPKKEKPSGIG